MEENTMKKEAMKKENEEEEEEKKEKKETEVKVVPWYNADEFRKVYKCVFSPDLQDKNWAVDTMTVWKTRVDPCLPAAIECTLLLTTTLCQDALFIANRTPTRQHFIELQYSCAIVRFVNLTVTVHEKYSMNKKQTVSQMAKLLGIPGFIVDLRNQISHTTLTPPLPHMRKAAVAALDYLKTTYWDKEAPRVKNYVKSRPNKTEYKEALSAYLKAKLKVVFHENTSVSNNDEKKLESNLDEKNDETDSNDEDDIMEGIKRVFVGGQGTKRKMNDESLVEHMDVKKMTYEENNAEKRSRKKHEKKMTKSENPNSKRKNNLLSELKKSLKVLDTLLDENKRIFVEVLVDESFVPADKELKYFVNKDTHELFTDVLDEHEDESPTSTPKESCIPDIPRLHEVLWLPIIVKLHAKDLIPLFLENLLLSQGNRSVIGQKLVLGWAIKILKIFCKEGRDSLTDEDQRLIDIFKKKGIVATWERLLKSALDNPCSYTPLVLPWITIHLTLDKSILDKYMTLLAIYLCQTVDEKTMKQPDRIFTLEDLKKAQRAEEARVKYLNKEVEECIFKKVTDDRLVNVPIGYRFPAVKTQNAQEEDNSEISNEVQNFKIEHIIGNSDSEDMDFEEYYREFKQVDDEPMLEDYMEEINEIKSFLYKPKYNI